MAVMHGWVPQGGPPGSQRPGKACVWDRARFLPAQCLLEGDVWPSSTLFPAVEPRICTPPSFATARTCNWFFWICPGDAVTINFTCHLDWITGCPDSWLNVISGGACEGVSSDPRTGVGRLSTLHRPPPCGLASPSLLRASPEDQGGRGKAAVFSCLTV